MLMVPTVFFKKTAAIQESWLQVTKKVFWGTEKSCLERIMIDSDANQKTSVLKESQSVLW